jgi:predicted Zn-dependent peptidase
MNFKTFSRKFTVLAFCAFLLSQSLFAQTANLPAPRQEKLLNGMKLLVWANPQAEKASVKLRIHSGSAFDPQTKEGVMALLADILFPNETAREYFTEDLGGSLEVTSNYDYIQINATGDNDKILDLLEALSIAVTKPQIDKDTTAKVKTARLEKVKELENNPSYVADNAVAKRLFGDYPYGRAQAGTTESLSKIDFADVLLAKQKFLTADNATLAVSGNVKFDLVYRAVRRYFGSWEKADKKVPATFTQSDAPDTKLQLIDAKNDSINEVRFAARIPARNDKNYIASKVLAKVVEKRFDKEFKQEEKSRASLRLNSNLLSGFIVVGLSNLIPDAEGQLSEKPPVTHQFSVKEENMIQLFLYNKISPDEIQTAKAEVLSEMNQKNTADFWLDIDTYKLTSVKDEMQKANEVTAENIQQSAEILVKQPAVKIWLVKQPASVKSTN